MRTSDFGQRMAIGLLCGGLVIAATAGEFTVAVDHTPVVNHHIVRSDPRCESGQTSSGAIHRGGGLDAAALQFLRNRVDVIIGLREADSTTEEMKLADSLGVMAAWVNLPIAFTGYVDVDSPAFLDGLADVLAALRDRGPRSVYVHCRHGKDRTGFIIALHRVHNECWSPAAALAEWRELQGGLRALLFPGLTNAFSKLTADTAQRRALEARLADRTMEFHESTRASNADCRLKVESRNLGHWLNTDLNVTDSGKLDDLVRLLMKDTQTDVFLLQEISPDVRETLTKRIGSRYEIVMADHCVDVAVLIRRGLGESLNVAAPSEFQIPQEGGGRGECSVYGVIAASVRIDAREYTFYSVHLPSNVIPRSSIGGRPVQKVRADLLRKLESHIVGEQAEGRIAIVGGDFNVEPHGLAEDSLALRAIGRRADAKDANAGSTQKIGGHFDHILAFSPGSTARLTHALGSAYARSATFDQEIRWTDHRAVRVELETSVAIPNMRTIVHANPGAIPLERGSR